MASRCLDPRALTVRPTPGRPPWLLRGLPGAALQGGGNGALATRCCLRHVGCLRAGLRPAESLHRVAPAGPLRYGLWGWAASHPAGTPSSIAHVWDPRWVVCAPLGVCVHSTALEGTPRAPVGAPMAFTYTLTTSACTRWLTCAPQWLTKALACAPVDCGGTWGDVVGWGWWDAVDWKWWDGFGSWGGGCGGM